MVSVLELGRCRVACLVVALLLLAPEARSQEEFRAWVSLVDPSQLGWLENENRLSNLCAEPSELAECHADKLSPTAYVYALHGEPDDASSRIGDLIVVAVPGRGLSAHYRPVASGRPIRFTPDLFLQDWGYGPYFRQTFSRQEGDWFRLPPEPWKNEVWVHREGERDDVRTVRAGHILEMDGSSWYVVRAEEDAIWLRAEQPGDMWCKDGEPPPLTPVEATEFSRAELVDAQGHWRFRPKYLKGC